LLSPLSEIVLPDRALYLERHGRWGTNETRFKGGNMKGLAGRAAVVTGAVNIASDAGRVGSSGESVYSACKGGIIAFTKTLAREHARHNVLLNALCLTGQTISVSGGLTMHG
jgi:hypothetical protein